MNRVSNLHNILVFETGTHYDYQYIYVYLFKYIHILLFFLHCLKEVQLSKWNIDADIERAALTQGQSLNCQKLVSEQTLKIKQLLIKSQTALNFNDLLPKEENKTYLKYVNIAHCAPVARLEKRFGDDDAYIENIFNMYLYIGSRNTTYTHMLRIFSTSCAEFLK